MNALQRSGRVAYAGAIHRCEPHAQGLQLGDGRVLAEGDVVWLPPFEVGNIIALGLNYADHLKELSAELTVGAKDEPLVFFKSPGSLVGHLGHTERPASVAMMHYECELAVVIGKPARKVRAKDAMAYVAGYTVCNDYAVRDYLENWYRPNLRVKNRDAATVLGPWLVAAEAVADPQALSLRTFVNGELKQLGTTANMVHRIPELIEYLSEFMTLSPGDVILTGTPEGVVNVQPGDQVVCEIDQIGRLIKHPFSGDFEMTRVNHLINGRSVDSERTFETLNPATQEVLAEVARGGEAEVQAAVAAAKSAFPAWAGLAPTERARLMRRLGELIAQHVPEIAATETRDAGQVISQTAKQLIPRAADNFHYFAEMCTRVDGHTYPTPSHLNYTLFHPVGVCALISPWNVPFMTATWKVAPCLAFGNTAVLKMSELSPLSAARLGELALEAGIPAGVLNIVHGYGQEAGEPLVRHPDVRAISFTGSTLTGNRIVQTAGLKKFSMELGGKSPFVVFEDADFERALDAAIFMIFSNNGERCTAGSRILVQQSIYARFVERFAERAQALVVGDPLNEKTIIGPMISAAHLAKVRHYIELGQKEGARLVCGGSDAPELGGALARGNFVKPTVFADVDNRMAVAQEEIFGPVACLIPFKDEAHAVALSNDIAYGLSSYVWTENIGRAHRVAAQIEAGMCFVNSQNVRDLRQPFGGTKASGTGREGGTWSYEVFLEPKNVCVSLGAHHIPHW